MSNFPNVDRHIVSDGTVVENLDIFDNRLRIVDNSDATKRVAFQCSGITTATTRTLTIPDASTTIVGTDATQTLTNKTLTAPTINAPVIKTSVTDTGGAYATPVVLTAADSGETILLDDAAGLDFTLPAIAASDVGINYRFYVVTTLTSNNYRFTAQSGDLLMGNVLIIDKDAATGDTNALFSVFRPDQSDDLILTIGGSADTSGRLTGGWLEFEAITATRWFVRGILIGDGSLVTVFS